MRMRYHLHTELIHAISTMLGHSSHPIHFYKVKAHSGIVGNEGADACARTAALSGTIDIALPDDRDPFHNFYWLSLKTSSSRDNGAAGGRGTCGGEKSDVCDPIFHPLRDKDVTRLGLAHKPLGTFLGQPWELQGQVEDAEDERGDFNSAASSVPLSSSSGLEEEDVYLSMPSVSLVERSKGSDELTPLQQIRQAVYASSDAIVRMGSWSSKARRRAMVSPDPPRLPQPSLQEDKAWTASIPVCNKSPPSTSTGGLAQPHKTVRGLSCCLSSRTPPTGSMGISPLHNLNSRVIPTGSMEKDAQPTQLKPCLSSGSELKPVKHVSFAPGGFDKTRGSSNKLDACGPSSHHRPQAPSSPDLSAMQYSSAGMYFFQGALGSCSRRTSSSGQASSALRRSWAGDPDFTEGQNLQDAGEEKEEEEEEASQLEFYQFAKPFGLGQGEELQMYVCGPPGDEDHPRNKDLTGCVVWRGKSGKRTRRNG
ncbi:hypothetical protein DUNSADRAFT_4943 [Dunaliella salina]|uniref:RNase H type-1 domain-containing protein n=1 Tax=Dunaliella salina TaxID=3046 RepID=A0ABQ7GQY1_DUNSA|nr:hypothetical protein DUNSADRAFT_4943 [Dunaliella salina]|eukprot:KAF5837018.1 hypothetical protein DUNSADRAFT_4943 [Dunaliella salina]